MNTPSLLDYQGLACPEPVIRLHALLKKHSPTTLPKALLILVDNEAAQENVTRVVSRYGYEVQYVADGKTWRITATRGNTNETTEALLQTLTTNLTNNNDPTAQTQKTLILLTTDTIGHGDDELGTRLMESFLATLPEMGENLWRIILLNAGVKLAATEGKCLDSLKNLEASGVDILVCGTCLIAYGCLANKAVGETTNMLDVVTSLDVADKVIRP